VRYSNRLSNYSPPRVYSGMGRITLLAKSCSDIVAFKNGAKSSFSTAYIKGSAKIMQNAKFSSGRGSQYIQLFIA
jgi:hypothetical protein